MSSKLKGKIFEYFMKELLIACGFIPVASDNVIVYDGKPGQMIQGLGQAHNADVLMRPSMQTPFYFPTSLLVECKCYNEPLGLPFVRNVLGLREDINHFDIVTPDILNARKNYHSKSPKYFPFDRYMYQVALASVSGFTRPAIEFAQVHRIPLISFAESSLFRQLRRFINSIDDDSLLAKYEWKDILNGDYDIIDQKEIRSFLDYVYELRSHMRIGLLENGTLLFLYQENEQLANNITNKEFTLHWGTEKNLWKLTSENSDYYFELPKEMLAIWKKESDGWQNEFNTRRSALQLKERYFAKIFLFDTKEESVRTLRLNKEFLDDAYVNILKDLN